MNELAHVIHGELSTPRTIRISQVYFEDRVVDPVLLVFAQRNGDLLGVVRSINKCLRDFGKGPELAEIFALVFEPLAKVVVDSGRVRKGSDDDTVHAASLDLSVYIFLVFNSVAAKLAYRAFTQRVVEDKEIEIAHLLSLLHANDFDLRLHAGDLVFEIAHVVSASEGDCDCNSIQRAKSARSGVLYGVYTRTCFRLTSFFRRPIPDPMA